MIEDLKAKIKSLDNSILELQNKRYKINEQYIDELYQECQKNIGRCFKNTSGNYYIIIKTSDIEYIYGRISFDDYRYETLRFKYPYDGSKIPFINKSINISNFRKNNDYKEIDFDELTSKLLEVNEAWLLTLNKNIKGE